MLSLKGGGGRTTLGRKNSIGGFFGVLGGFSLGKKKGMLSGPGER